MIKTNENEQISAFSAEDGGTVLILPPGVQIVCADEMEIGQVTDRRMDETRHPIAPEMESRHPIAPEIQSRHPISPEDREVDRLRRDLGVVFTREIGQGLYTK